MSPPQKGLPLHVKESPGHCSLTLLNFLDSTYCYLELGSFACLLNVCLAFKTESFLQAGTLLSCSPQCPGHVAQGTWVFTEWTASLPVSSILSRFLSSQSSCLYLCLSPAWLWHLDHGRVLGLHKKAKVISQAGDPSRALLLPPAHPQLCPSPGSSQLPNHHPQKPE